MLIVLLTIWLSIVGPMPDGFAAWLYQWQTLAGAGVASIAVYIAVRNTTRSLDHAEGLERHRRSRKNAALRAMLPLALAQVTDYAERSAHALNAMLDQCDGEALPAMTAPESLAQQLPSETLSTLADFIEYSDRVDVALVETAVAWIQIQDSRLRDLIKRNRGPGGGEIITRAEIEGRLIDAATIYASASSVYNYARRRQEHFPHTISWEAVRGAFRNMRFWDDEHPRLYAIMAGRENHTTGPFDALHGEPAA